MAFDHRHHYVDEKGFARHKETGHLIGIEPRPPEKHPDEGSEFPKWVTPHHSHVHRSPRGVISTPGFLQHHETRDGEVHVVVHDADDEARALSPA